MKIYVLKKILRTTSNGCAWLSFRWVEDFGSERGYSRSWGCREKRGTGKIWVKNGESLEEAILRRRADFAE